MIELTSTQKKVLDLYHNDGPQKAWNYWKLMGNTYGIFLGEVPSDEFIDGKSLANHIGLTEGRLCNVVAPWLKFILDGNIVYVPMKPLMHSVTWNAINECGAVFENEGATINVGGENYDITLLRGVNRNCIISGRYYGWDMDFTHTSEWNRLMYPIHSGIHTDNDNPSNPSVPYAQWATYSDVDLTVYHGTGNGTVTWVQEAQNTDTTFRFIRGGNGVTYVRSSTTTLANSNIGWRPALRLIPND